MMGRKPIMIRNHGSKHILLTALVATGFCLYYMQSFHALGLSNIPNRLVTPSLEAQEIPNKIWYNVRPPSLNDEFRGWAQTRAALVSARKRRVSS